MLLGDMPHLQQDTNNGTHQARTRGGKDQQASIHQAHTHSHRTFHAAAPVCHQDHAEALLAQVFGGQRWRGVGLRWEEEVPCGTTTLRSGSVRYQTWQRMHKDTAGTRTHSHAHRRACT
jgi:hypothetical protein